MRRVSLGALVIWGVVAWLPNVVQAAKGTVVTEVPEVVDPQQRYLFYLHGAWIEQHGLQEAHPKHGRYAYREIVEALADQGFVVISEARTNPVHPVEYAGAVAEQVRVLLDRGVPPEHITIAGHSKGGHMAMLVASELEEPALNVVVMAGCGKRGTEFRRSYDQFLAKRADQLTGRILSLYDAADREAGSCQEAFDLAADVQSKEQVFRTGKGHGLFYAPESLWLNEVVELGAKR